MHPALIELYLKFKNDTITGANRRFIAFLTAI